jgi:hypothetical protein
MNEVSSPDEGKRKKTPERRRHPITVSNSRKETIQVNAVLPGARGQV